MAVSASQRPKAGGEKDLKSPQADKGKAWVGALRWLWVTATAGATALYFLLPAPGPDVIYSTVGALSVGLIVAGVLIFRPSNPLAWYLLAAGHLMLVLADIVYYVYKPITGSLPPYPSFIDAIYLSSYPLTAAGLVLLVRCRSPGRDRAALIDASIIATAGALLTWVFLIAPYATDAALTMSEKIVSIAYPCMDVLLLGVAARLVVGAGYRGLSYRLLVSAFVLSLIADVAYGGLVLSGNYFPPNPIDVGWLFSYGLLATAAIHPSMRPLSETTSTTSTKLTRGRLAALAIASLTAPATLGIQAALGQPIQAPVFVGSCVLLFLLVLTRTWRLVREVETKARNLEKQGHVLASSLDQRDALENQLKHLAFHDSLTGLANRALFDDRLQHAIARSTRSKEPLAIMFLDMDGFKSINDDLGHAAGDAVLVEVAQRLSRCLRITDTVARFGGDEFAILIEGEGALDTVATRSRIEMALSEPFVVELEAIALRASVGIAVSPSDGTDAVELLASADAAMYVAKDPGRSRVLRPLVSPSNRHAQSH
jgi:diguanylate cyclase (GGDEF)-like protein